MLLNFTCIFLYPFLLIYNLMFSPSTFYFVLFLLNYMRSTHGYMAFYDKVKIIFTSNLLQTQVKKIIQTILSIQFHTNQKKKDPKAESPDNRRAYICPSNHTAGQMSNPLGYRGTPGLGWRI